jgi:hypothetical protein
MKSPYQVSRVNGFWSLTRTDGEPLNPDGAVAYNFDDEDMAIEALKRLSTKYYADEKRLKQIIAEYAEWKPIASEEK